MSTSQPFIFSIYPKAITALLVSLVLFSCKAPVFVKKYQPGKPFVYQTNIQVNGNFSSDSVELLKSRLKSQLDDSMRSRSVSKLLWSVMKTPPVYDVSSAEKSMLFMRSLLVSLGYFKDTITYKAVIDSSRGKQYRTTVTFSVTPGKQVTIDSFAYNIKNTELQNIALANQKEALVKEGAPFAKSNISAELDRLVDIYRNSGYMRFGREDLYGLWDTLDVSLLNPNLDPFEQLALLEKIKERRLNPKANLEIRLKSGTDSSKLRKYFVGNVTVYPDYTIDTALYKKDSVMVNGVKVISYQHMFKPKMFPQNIYLHQGDLYDQRNYFRTINRFNSLGAWRLVNVEQNIRPGQDSSDFTIKLTPAKKYSFSANFEASQNKSVFSGNLIGFGINTGIQNRNFARSAIQSNTNLRYYVELGSNFIQTQQASISHNIYFPRVIPKSKWLPERWRNNIRTVFSSNAAITQRRLLYNLASVNASWGYEYQKTIPGTNKGIQVSWKIPNIEYARLDKKDSLNKLIANNPALKNSFTDGFISSTIVGLTLSNAQEKKPRIFSASLEVPFIANFIPSNFLDTQLYQFIKANAEYTQQYKRRKSSIVIRAFAGIGYALNSTKNELKKNSLPFYRQYFAGGPSSMRAWRLRRLGPGSSKKDFASNPERLGDMQLEFNLEYRFDIAKVSGVRIESALFTDIGNVWGLKKNSGAAEEVFNFSRLGKDLAVGIGTGLRIDFSFFLLRLDYAYKAKDPSPDVDDAGLRNKWFGYKFFKGDQFQLGINYPFKL